MGQSFREIAKLLGLARNDQEMQDAAAATLKVKNWLTEARKCPIYFAINLFPPFLTQQIIPIKNLGRLLEWMVKRH